MSWNVGPSTFSSAANGVAYNESLLLWNAVGENRDDMHVGAYTTDPTTSWTLANSSELSRLNDVAASNTP